MRSGIEDHCIKNAKFKITKIRTSGHYIVHTVHNNEKHLGHGLDIAALGDFQYGRIAVAS